MLVSKKELTNLKLRSIKSDDLKELAGTLGINAKGTASNLIKKLIDIPQNRTMPRIWSSRWDGNLYYYQNQKKYCRGRVDSPW